MEKNYKILGLKVGDTLEEIVKKYSELLKEFDPKEQDDELKEFFNEEQKKVKKAYKDICLNLIMEKGKEEELITIDDKVVKKVSKEKEKIDVKGDKIKHVKNNIEEREIDKEDMSRYQKKYYQKNLSNAAYWARIIGVLMIILGVIQIMELLKVYELYEEIEYDYNGSRENHPSFVPSFIYYGLCILFFFMVGHAANKFTTKIRLYLATKDNNNLIEGLEMLSLYFKRILIFLIIIGTYSSLIMGSISFKEKTITKKIVTQNIIASTPFTNLIFEYLEKQEKKKRKKEERREKRKRRY